MNERIDTGIRITQEAIEASDPALLARCLSTFKSAGATMEDITRALSSCPLSLLSETGLAITVKSGLLGKDIILGRDITWEALRGVFDAKVGKEGILEMFNVKDIFSGRIESVRKVGSVD